MQWVSCSNFSVGSLKSLEQFQLYKLRIRLLFSRNFMLLSKNKNLVFLSTCPVGHIICHYF